MSLFYIKLDTNHFQITLYVTTLGKKKVQTFAKKSKCYAFLKNQNNKLL